MTKAFRRKSSRVPVLALGILLAGISLLFNPVSVHAAKVTSRTIRYNNVKYHYRLFSPDKSTPLPAILLLHGAGDIPDNMIAAWKKFASQNRIVLVAPVLPREVKFEPLAPAVFRCVINDAEQQTAINPRRVYVFGNSMGGYLAYDAAMFDSDYFAAVAVTGMVIAPRYDWILTRAKRKTPIAIYMGDHDQFSSLASARRTRDLLIHAGFPVQYVELENHDHDYYALSNRINSSAWQFFQKYKLPAVDVGGSGNYGSSRTDACEPPQ
ncbi:MAG: carboxylesterase family protein [Candidatus Acidiferrales bacterium]